MTRFLPFALILTALALPEKASAKKFALITSGDTITEYGEIQNTSDPIAQRLKAQGLKVGYYFDYFGIFWLDIWTWGGKWVIYKDNKAQPITKAQAEQLLGESPGALSKPFWYKFPPLLMIIILVVVLGVAGIIISQREKKRYNELMDDERYRVAIGLLMVRVAREGAEAGAISDLPGWDEAIDHLRQQGIDIKEAEDNLSFMVRHAAEKVAKENES